MRSVFRRFSASNLRIGKGHALSRGSRYADVFQISLDTFLSNSWPYESISPLQAYLLGVFTCVVIFVATNIFLKSSITAAQSRSRGGSRKRKLKKQNSLWKRKNRNNFLSIGTTLPMTSPNSLTEDIRHTSPLTRVAERSLSQDKVYRILTTRIRERAAKRTLHRSNRMVKNNSGTAIGNDLDQNPVSRAGRRHRYDNSTNFLCSPIARNRALYNQSRKSMVAARHPKKIQIAAPKTPSTTSAYNDGDVWPSSSTKISNESSYELFKHMNSQPLRKEAQKSSTDVIANDNTQKTHHSQHLHKDAEKSLTSVAHKEETKQIHLSSSGQTVRTNKIKNDNGQKTATPEKTLKFGKENINNQRMGIDDSKNVTPRSNRKSNIPRPTSRSSKRKSDSPSKATFPAMDTGLKGLQSKKDRLHSDDQIKNTIDSSNLPSASETSKKTLPIALESRNGGSQCQHDFDTKEKAGDEIKSKSTISNPINPKKESPFDSNPQQIVSEVPCKSDISRLEIQAQFSSYSTPVKRIGQPLPAIESGSTEQGDFGNKSSPPAPKARLTVLISSSVYDYIQASNQKAALTLLNDLCIPYDTVDGMDPLRRKKRDAFFKLSGIRGNYPQIFISAGDKNAASYLGGYDWLHSTKIEDLLTIVNVDQKRSPSAKSDATSLKYTAAPSSTTTARADLTVLISNGVYDYTQAANQKATLNLLNDLDISYTVVDGMDPSQKEKRDAFFNLSGIRGNYPQIFLNAGAGDAVSYLGGYAWLCGSNIEGLKDLTSK